MNPTFKSKKPNVSQWAKHKLGVGADASLDEARAAFLRQLADCRYLPAPVTDDSFRYLQASQATPDSAKPPPDALLDEENRLRHEIEVYADAFFTLPVTSRKQKWILLFSRSSWCPPLAAWLNALKSGLSIDLTKIDPPAAPVQRLMSRLCFLFTLRPFERAHRRREILTTIDRDKEQWSEAAKTVSEKYPNLAELDRELIAVLLRNLEEN